MDDINVDKKQLVPNDLPKSESSIGKLLLDLGKIKAEDAERIIRLQKADNIRFGDAAQ